MKKLLFFFLISISFEKLSAENLSKVYFAGGCFWCMEESFDKIEGVKKTISGYSGGHVKNPKYRDVIKNTTGHYETLEITYNPSEINFSKLLEVYWVNIDPFDINGQFCDKGESYKSVIFYRNDKEKKIVEESIKRIEKRFNKKVVTYIKRFKEFYEAETYHQDYYEKNFIRYLLYKKNCQREEILNNIWR
tara:strand:+ start:254 stop:826 length:573 start_codon:yes stop_codon:yes gene_type:complete